MPHRPNISSLPLLPLTLAVTLLLLSLSSCTSIREAQQVVTEADSLRTAGVQYSDSTAMAEAAATLEPFRLFYPTDYAHANYYYGRILRTQGNQPEAMLAFLRVVHSRTKDHAIKARAYSNIANMCRLATEHDLAYTINEMSANEFLIEKDTLLYYYALNNMAYDLAEAHKSIESLALTKEIAKKCSDYGVLSKLWETRTAAYTYAEQYDSVISYVNLLQNRGYNEPTGLLFKARAYSCLGLQDSAVYYAQIVVERTHSWFDINNAYYILANDDEHKNKEEALQVAADRSDVQKLIEIRQGQLSQATQLLQQDLNRKPDLRWLLAVFLTIAIIATILSLYVKRKRRKRQLISQQVASLQQEKATLSSQTQHLKSVHTEYEEQVKHKIVLFCQNVLSSSNPQEYISWDDYNRMRVIINENIFGLADKLENLGLATHEIRFCVLVLFGLNRKECARWMNLGVSSMGGKKRDIAKKLGQTSSNLYDFLLSLALK